MATIAQIDPKDVLAVLQTNPPFTDSYAFNKAMPYVRDLLKIIGTSNLDKRVRAAEFFGILADMIQLIKLEQGQSYFGYFELSRAEFNRTLDGVIRALRDISDNVPMYLKISTLTEAESLISDGVRLIPPLQAEAEAGTLTYRKILQRQPGIFFPRPFH